MGILEDAILAGLLDATDAGVFFVSSDLRVQYLNRRVVDFFALSPEAAVGTPVAALIDELAVRAQEPETFVTRSRELYADLALEMDDVVELFAPQRRLLRRKSGPVRDGNGQLLGRIEVYVDHTEALDRRDLLEAQNRDLDAFASRLAHEIKTPLVGLRGFADLLAQRHARQLDERGGLYLEKIRSSATLLNEMVDGLRNLVDASRQVETCESVDPVPVLRMVAEALTPEAEEKGVELHLPTAAPRVRCDEAKLFQVFQNLLSNAVRHCDIGKPVRWVDITFVDAGAEVEVQFTDNGLGLAPDEMAEIFQPFRRGRSAAGKPGMGLGLAISRRVAQMCAGRIEVQSRLGEGSLFSLFLPRAD